jgi:hypothetical protein
MHQDLSKLVEQCVLARHEDFFQIFNLSTAADKLLI